MIIIWLVIGLGVLAALAFLHWPVWGWTLFFGFLLYMLTTLGMLGFGAWLLWPLFLIAALFMNYPPIRQQMISTRVLAWFKKVLPPMSQTETQAIEAGNTGWEKELFQGSPRWKNLDEIPKVELSKAETNFLENQVETLCEMINDWKVVHEEADLPLAAWEYLKKEKFFGIIIPKKYNGLEFSTAGHSAVIAKIATRSVSAAVTTMVPNSLGPAELLLHYGTEEQKNYYLPRLASGEEIPCFALTGPDAGSDAGDMVDTGIVCIGEHEGQEVLGIRLTFDKRYITLAPVATVMGLAFQMMDPDHLLGDVAKIGVTLCLIPMDHPGVQSGHRHFPMNLAFMNGPLRGKEVFIPMDWIIGGKAMAGRGWRMLMECLSAGRGISLPALSTAAASLTYKTTGAYCMIRRQFGLPIGEFEGVESALGEMAGWTYLLEATRLFTIAAIDKYSRPAIATAIAKYHMTELSRKIINHAMDVHGGRGIMMGPTNYLARGYQSIPVSITVEGANILTRNLIIFGQGAIRCHPYLKDEINCAQSPEAQDSQALKKFDELLMKHAGYFIANFSRCLLLSLTRGYAGRRNRSDKTMDLYIKKLNWLSAALAYSSDVAMLLLGGALKRREQLSARLGDVLSQLYLASATIKFFEDNGQQENEIPTVEWILQMCLFEAQEAFYGLFENFPHSIVRVLLKWTIFPYGRAFSRPKDELTKQLARSMMARNSLQEKLSSICYIDKDKNDPVQMLDMASSQLIQVRGTIEKMQLAIRNKEIPKHMLFEDQITMALDKKLIDESEAEQYKTYESLRKKIIAVDEFTPDYALGTK